MTYETPAATLIVRNSGFGDSTGADTTGANAHCLVGLPIKHPDALKVGIPAPPCEVMGVAHPVSINRTFIADFAARHGGNLPKKVSGEV